MKIRDFFFFTFALNLPMPSILFHHTAKFSALPKRDKAPLSGVSWLSVKKGGGMK